MFSFIFCLLFVLSAFAASEVAQTISYQGRLFNAAGTAPSTDQVDFIFSLYAPTGNNCLLYQETQSADLSVTDGLFSFQIGSFTGAGKRTVSDPGLTMATIFGSRAVSIRAAATPNCTAGYTPAAGDVRRLRVTVSRNAGAYVDLSPDQSLNSTATAIVAQTLQGYLPSNFVMTSTNITQAHVESLTDGSDASTLHHHDSLYLAPSSLTSQNLGSAGVFTTGAVGIGTSILPTSKLEVKGAGATSATSSLNVMDSASTSLLFVRNDGNVGIGQASPNYFLDVLSTATGNASVGAQIKTATGGGLMFGAFNSTYGGIWSANVTPSTSNYMITSNGATTVLNATSSVQTTVNNATAITTVTSTGLGIGTIAPTKALEVYDGVANGGLRVTRSTVTSQFIDLIPNNSTESVLLSMGGNNKPAVIANHGAQPMHFSIGGNGIANAKMSIDTTGNVGIGTTSPDAQLKILGTDSAATKSFEVLNSTSQVLISALNNRTLHLNSTNGASGDTNIGTTEGAIYINRGYNNAFYRNSINFYAGGDQSTIQGFNSDQGMTIGYAQTVTNPNPSTTFAVKGRGATSAS